MKRGKYLVTIIYQTSTREKCLTLVSLNFTVPVKDKP